MKAWLALAVATALLATACSSPPVAPATASRRATALVMSTMAGTGTPGFGGDAGQSLAAQLQYPRGLAVDGDGNIYVADTYNHRVRVITPKGLISTLAGDGLAGSGGDGGPAREAHLNLPRSVAVDGGGNVFIADLGNNRVRRVDPSGIISTVAGTGVADFNGDGGAATAAALNAPAGVVVDGAGALIIADTFNHRIRKVIPGGIIGTIAGTGSFGSQGDGGQARKAEFNRPTAVAVDRGGTIFVADTGNNRIRKITPAGIISTVAGDGGLGFAGDGGPATEAELSSPKALALDGDGRLLIADTGNNRVREVGAAGVIRTIAGSGVSSFSGDGGPATAASIVRPYGVAIDHAGAVFVSDTGNNRVRKVAPGRVTVATASVPAASPTPSFLPVTGGTNVYAAITSGQIPAALAGVPARVYVPCEGSGNVLKIDPASFRVIDRLPSGRTPHHVTPSWDMTRLFVNNMDSDSLSVIDPRAGKIVGTIPVTAPYNLYYALDGSKAIVVSEPVDRLEFYDPRSWHLLRSLPIPWEGVNHLDLSADGSFLLVSTEYDGFVVKVDLGSMSITGQLDVGGLPTDVKLSADGSVFFVANQGRNGVSIIDPVAMKEIGFVLTGRGAHGMVVSRDAKSLYVTNRLEGTIAVIDFVTRQFMTKWTIGGSPDMGQVSPDGKQLWVSSRFDNRVYVIDTGSGRVIATIATDAGPHGLSFFPQPGRFSVGHNGVYR